MLRVKGKNKRSRCIVPGCVSSTGEEKLTCFTFPKNPDLRRKWEKFCQKSSERIESSLDYICERHFNVTDILWRRQTKVLRKGSVPIHYSPTVHQEWEELLTDSEREDSLDSLAFDEYGNPLIGKKFDGSNAGSLDAGPKILLKNSSSPYTNPDVLGGFQDVQLLSNDGHHLKINKSVFIANCKMLRRQILEADSAGESVMISTELSSAALAEVVNFLISGIIPCGQLESSSTKAFKLFGISLSKLSFTKVNVAHCDKTYFISPSKNTWPTTVTSSSVSTSLDKSTGQPGATDPSRFATNSEAFEDVKVRVSSDHEPVKAEDEEDYQSLGKPSGAENDDQEFRGDEEEVIEEKEEQDDRDSNDDEELTWNSEEEEDSPPARKKRKSSVAFRNNDGKTTAKKRSFRVGKVIMAKIRKQIAREERERALRLKQQIRRSGEEDDEGEDLKGTEHSKSARMRRRRNQLIHQAVAARDYKDEIARIKADPVLLAEFPQEGQRNYDHRFQCPLCVFGAENFGSMMAHSKRHKIAMEGEVMLYTCKMCNTPIKNKCELEKHYRSYHPEWLACPECSLPFKISTGILAYIKHMKEAHNLDRGGICSKCGFASKDKCRIHRHNEEMGPNHSQDQCVQCDFEFKTWEEHRSHVEVAHSNIWKFKCGFCPEIFDSLEDAKSHKKSEHPSEVKVRKRPKAMTCCYVCGKEMQTTHLQVHLESVHGTGGNTFLCSMCPKILTSSSKLKVHMRLSHLSVNRYKCDQCDRAFATKTNLSEHKVNIHTSHEDKPFQCSEPGCKMGFSNIHHLNDHKVKHSKERLFQCSFCETRFKRQSCRKQHEQRFHPNGEPKPFLRKPAAPGKKRNRAKAPAKLKRQETRPKKPVESPPCQHCGKTFRDPQNLKNHIFNKHTPDEEKPYRCQHCPKGFGTRNHLDTHMNSHTNARPYKCHICQSAFNALSQRNRHVKQVHKETPQPFRSGERLTKKKKNDDDIDNQQRRGDEQVENEPPKHPLQEPTMQQQLLLHQQQPLPPLQSQSQHQIHYEQM